MQLKVKPRRKKDASDSRSNTNPVHVDADVIVVSRNDSGRELHRRECVGDTSSR